MKAHGPADAVSAAKRAEGPSLDDFLLNIVAGGRLVSTRASHVAGVCVCALKALARRWNLGFRLQAFKAT
jgi:hypothetical protein